MTTQLPVIINVRDRFAPLRDLVAWLERVGQREIHLCDNASTYEPLLDYLAASPHHVVRLGENLGHRAPWLSGLVTELGLDRPFIVTDPDVVPSEECPDDALDVFLDVLLRYPELDKVGFSLRLDDLPRHYAHRDAVLRWEAQFWQRRHASGFWQAAIDTTLAVYRPGEHHQNDRAVRSPHPYVARHMPWYQDSGRPDPEQTYYLEHADTSIINWDQKVLPASLRAYLRTLDGSASR